MTTSLKFEAPTDLSVGRVRITGPTGIIADWIATPDTRSFEAEILSPGVYSADISPTGVATQSIVFNVEPGVANTVSAPLFAALAATGSDANTMVGIGVTQIAASLVRENAGGEKNVDDELRTTETTLAIDKFRRRISIGLSQEHIGERDSFGFFEGEAYPELSGSQLLVDVRAPQGMDIWHGQRIRLSVAIEKLRIERFLVPLYIGGTSISVTPSPLASGDVSLQVMPLDPWARALVRTLQAGTSAEASALKENLLTTRKIHSLNDGVGDDDPWVAILTALLFVRFPDVFEDLSLSWMRILAAKASWAFDAHTVFAWRILRGVEGDHAQAEAVSMAVELLEKAQACGSPYFSYANKIFVDLVSGLQSYVQDSELASRSANVQITKRIRRIAERQQRLAPLQSSAGAAFSWLARDLHILKKERILAPNRRASGNLRSRDTKVIFRGNLSAGEIGFDTSPRLSHKKTAREGIEYKSAMPFNEENGPQNWPGSKRPTGPADDPNKGRFGGLPSFNGFSLTAQFARVKQPKWIDVNLQINAEEDIVIPGDIAWFCLHPTFSPQWVRVMFAGSKATLPIKAWGGFTVGVWLPRLNTELECDLALLSNAPLLIKEK